MLERWGPEKVSNQYISFLSRDLHTHMNIDIPWYAHIDSFINIFMSMCIYIYLCICACVILHVNRIKLSAKLIIYK